MFYKKLFLVSFGKKIIIGKSNTCFGKINVDMLSVVEAAVFLIYTCVIVIFIFLATQVNSWC